MEVVMRPMPFRPTVFIASSTEALKITQTARRFLSSSANVLAWTVAFDPGDWTLQALLDHSQQSDFGIFVMAPDDKSVIRGKRQWSVRDNVLFELGLFMGALGPKRTFLLWPSSLSSKLRLPSDLLGLTTIGYNHDAPNSTSHLKQIRDAIDKLGPALRSSYNELAILDQLMDQREQVFVDNSSKSFKQIICNVARRRRRRWFTRTPVDLLLHGIHAEYASSVVDNIFWWLIIDGVITFDNIEVWTDGDFHWKSSVDYAVFTDRGVAWLNQLQDDPGR
ncbi:MAG: hypothetical protein C5B46_05835 [Proteobacteria bacterium]|nr:MAG: hypothetical protein C5B46_05835 [Pseudomonadota bacterium]